MTTLCEGTQGTHFRVSGNGIDQEFVSGGGVTVAQSSSSTVAYAVWNVFTQTGSSSPTSRGFHGISSNNSFIVVNVWNSTRRVYFSRLTHTGAPSGSLRSWTSSQLSYFSHQVFSHGSLPVTTYSTVIKAASGSTIWQGSSQSGYHNVSVLACGCDESDCQQGTFPTDFCCTNCAQQSGILQEIISALQARNN